MKKYLKSNRFPKVVIFSAIIIWGVVFVFDIFDLPSQMGFNIAHVNFEIWSVLASITSGVLTFLGVLWTIKTGKEEREEDRIRLEKERREDREQLEKDRKEEEKQKAKPYLAVAGNRADNGFKYYLKFGDSNNGTSHGSITVINNAICILHKIVIASKDITERRIVIGNENIVFINFSGEATGDCYLYGEDILGNKYRYSLVFNKGALIEVGMPIEIKEEEKQ